MAIKRYPHSPMFRIVDGSKEMMRFRAKNAGTAKAECRKQTAVLRKLNPEKWYGLEKFDGHMWTPVELIQ